MEEILDEIKPTENFEKTCIAVQAELNAFTFSPPDSNGHFPDVEDHGMGYFEPGRQFMGNHSLYDEEGLAVIIMCSRY